MTSVAIAILYSDAKFLMQLRDPLPTILYPGHWGLFGGHLEPGESPEAGVRRELWEEIRYCPDTLEYFGLYGDGGIQRHVFWGQLGVGLTDLCLNEGWDLALIPAAAIQRGSFYSPRPGKEQPLGAVHQRILLEFMAFAQARGFIPSP